MWFMMMVLFAAVMCHLPPTLSTKTKLRTLRTFRVHGCDDDELHIECQSDTIISITAVDYGIPVDRDLLCPFEFTNPKHVKGNQSVIPPCPVVHPVKAVEAVCKDKRECNLKVHQNSLTKDPCPGIRKYLDISYKCRPASLLTKVACKNEKFELRCRKPLRIVIYNASYGSTPSGAPECPMQKRHKSENCQASYVTETVVEACHGRLKCKLFADENTFGSPGCTERAHVYLSVKYTCVSKDILQDLEIDQDAKIYDFVEAFESSDVTGLHNLQEVNILQTPSVDYDSNNLLDLSISTTQEVDILSDENTDDALGDVNCTVVGAEQKFVGFITEWIAAYKFIAENKEKFILYLTVSLGAGLLAFLIVLAVRLYIQQRRQLKKAKLNISEPLPLTLEEDCSDLDQYDPRHDHSIEVVRYTNTSTVRRQDSDSQPRAPLSHSMNSYYYT